MVQESAAKRIVVIGGGKMGLPLACMFASQGASVTVCDTNPSIVASVNSGIDPHNEPEQDRYIREGVAVGRLRARDDTAAEGARADAGGVLVSAVVTPERGIDWGNPVDATPAGAQ